MKSDRGSIAPLAIGLVLVALAAIAVVGSASSLFVAHRRLQTLAESTALASALNFGYGPNFLKELPSDYSSKFAGLRLVRNQVVDGATVEVTLCANWLNPVLVSLVQATAEICADANARLIAN